jgi:hypothetical protein
MLPHRFDAKMNDFSTLNKMAPVQSKANSRARSTTRRKNLRRISDLRSKSSNPANVIAGLLLVVAGAFIVYWALDLHAHYTFSLQSPIRVHLQWPFVIARRLSSEEAAQAQLDQRRPLTAYQEYACMKFGSACRVALAIQRAEINTVHLKRAGLNLRDLLDCRANIDFAYQLYSEHQSFAAWSSYNNGLYRRFLHR